MNERIKELAEQAKEYADTKYSKLVSASRWGDCVPGIRELYTERLAELIVKECLSKVDKAGSNFNEQPQYNDKQNALVSEGFFWALESVKQQVKEHLGVKE
jgi:hypothetical protein